MYLFYQKLLGLNQKFRVFRYLLESLIDFIYQKYLKTMYKSQLLAFICGIDIKEANL